MVPPPQKCVIRARITSGHGLGCKKQQQPLKSVYKWITPKLKQLQSLNYCTVVEIATNWETCDCDGVVDSQSVPFRTDDWWVLSLVVASSTDCLSGDSICRSDQSMTDGWPSYDRCDASLWLGNTTDSKDALDSDRFSLKLFPDLNIKLVNWTDWNTDTINYTIDGSVGNIDLVTQLSNIFMTLWDMDCTLKHIPKKTFRLKTKSEKHNTNTITMLYSNNFIKAQNMN